MENIIFDPTKDFLGTYELEENLYVIQDEKVFVLTNGEYILDETISPDEIQFYGTRSEYKNFIYELKILEIKMIDSNTALIHADDGSDFDFWIYEDNYEAKKDLFKENEICKIRLFAEVLSSELPEDYREGVTLTGDDAKKWFAWMDDDVEEDASALVCLKEIATYSKTKDFSKTGIYNFSAIVNEPGMTDDPKKGDSDIFTIAAMNQFNKKDPRYIIANFVNAPYSFPEFTKLDEDEDDFFQPGWALKGTIRFVAEIPIKENSVDRIYKYGKNAVTFAEDKGFFNQDFADFEEDDNLDFGM